MAAFFKENAARITACQELSEQAINSSFSNDKIRFTNTKGNNLYHQRRTYKDGELLFLVNSSLTETAQGSVAIEGKSLQELDGMSGEIFAYPARRNGKYMETTFSLPPAGSLILFSSSSPGGSYKVKPQIASSRVLNAGTPLEVKRLKDNALTLDFCDLIIDGKPERNLYTVEACNKLFRHFGMNDPWNSAIQYRRTIVERDTFKTGDIKVNYQFIVAGDINRNQLKLIAEQPDIWKVKINGNPVSSDGASFLDTRFGTYSIGKHAKMGVNVIELSVSPMSIYAEIAPVYVTGDFSLEPAPTGWVVREPVNTLKPGSWKEQGMACYSWDVSYSKTYRIEDTSARYALQLNKWKGTVAEVFVNGQKAGVIAYQPYNFDLSPYLKKGDNKIEVRVIGSLRNLFGPHYSHDQGIMGPWHWNGVQKQAPGCDYNLADYGLMEDFNVITSK